MALPRVIIRTDEHVRLVSPVDDAIDHEATGADAVTAYAARRDLDTSKLVLRGNPTWFTIRPLNERMRRALDPLLPAPHEYAPCQHPDCALEHRLALEHWRTSASGNEPPAHCYRLSRAYLLELAAQYLRFGLVKVEGLPGWEKLSREEHLGQLIWPVEATAELDATTLQFLGLAVLAISELTPEKKSASGSSQIAPGGTASRSGPPGNGTAPGPSTGAPALASVAAAEG